MGAAGSSSHDQNGSEGRTLGDILDAAKSRPRASEQHWVNLIRSIAAGNQSALHSLFEQSHRFVFTLAMRITNNPATAEEVTLDVFHEVWRRASSYDPAGGPVVGWIMNQARSRAIDRLRFEQRQKRIGNSSIDLSSHTEVGDPQDSLKRQEQSRILQNALNVLTPEERKVIETAFFSELTYSETATKLNQPLGTVKTRIRSALNKLREALNTYVR